VRRLPRPGRARLRRRSAGGNGPGARHAAVRLQRGVDPPRVSRIGRSVRGAPAQTPLRLQGQLDTGDPGSAADANSIGEIDLALRAGFAPSDIVFTGVGKAPEELERAVVLGLKAINAESAGELERIDQTAQAHGTRARVALRVNPDIDSLTHPHISTGLRRNKFGVPLEQARALCRRTAERQGLHLVGLHAHLGSQIVTLGPLARSAATLVELARQLSDDGIRLEHLDLGGGLGISYDGSPVPTSADYAAAILPIVRQSGLALALEPGRAIVGAAGVLVARVVDLKEYPGGQRFAVLDAGMTELIRPALYGAFHRIEPVVSRVGLAVRYDIVGPVCESSDVFGQDRLLPPVAVGDLMAVLDAGAYGSAMASTYNRRPLPAEVLVDGGRWSVIRRRQTIDDLVALES
jgi:diaminopimelate decarboxylase